MKKCMNLVGMKFGHLTVVEKAENHIQPSGKSVVMWKCKCDCGNESIILASNLTSGNSTRCKKCCNNFNSYKHGDSPISGKTRLYRIWLAMKNRCSNPKAVSYNCYGGKGIKVCNEWMDYQKFKQWALENGYSDNLTIDRKDNGGNYEPANCRWITLSEQQSNRTNCHFIEYKGKRQILKDWAKELNMPASRLSARLINGWSVEDAFTKTKGYAYKRNGEISDGKRT